MKLFVVYFKNLRKKPFVALIEAETAEVALFRLISSQMKKDGIIVNGITAQEYEPGKSVTVFDIVLP